MSVGVRGFQISTDRVDDTLRNLGAARAIKENRWLSRNRLGQRRELSAHPGKIERSSFGRCNRHKVLSFAAPASAGCPEGVSPSAVIRRYSARHADYADHGRASGWRPDINLVVVLPRGTVLHTQTPLPFMWSIALSAINHAPTHIHKRGHFASTMAS